MAEPDRNRLEAMPCNVMEEILKNINYVEIQRLRKVSSSMRKLVDFTLFDTKIRILYIFLGHGKIDMHFTFSEKEKVKISYVDVNDGCEVSDVSGRLGRHFFANTTSASLVRKDFKTLKSVFINQPSPVEVLEITFREHGLNAYHDTIALSLTSPPHLRVKILSLRYGNGNRPSAMSVLPYVCPDTLEHLQIDAYDRQHLLNADAIFELSHSKRLQVFHAKTLRITDPMCIVHIPMSHIRLNMITLEQVKRLIQAFRNFEAFEFCEIRLDNINDRLEILNAITPDVPYWFPFELNFRSSRPGWLLKMTYPDHGIIFRTILETDLS